jgi:vitamin K-dependent gamma-carboxylase
MAVRPTMTEPSRIDAVRAALYRPVDGAGLAAFRVLFGLMMCTGVVRFMANGWIDRFYGEPGFFFKFWGFEWVPVPPVPALYALFAVLAIAALCIALGAFYRVAAAVFFLGFTYAQLLDVTSYLNHYYLVCLLALLLVFAPLHRTWSVDSWRTPALATGTVPAWALWILRLQVGAVYFYAGLAKLDGDWLLHAQPLNLWFTARTETPIIGSLLAEPWVAYAASWGVLAFELAAVPLLLWSRSRPYIYAVIIAFHAMTHVFFDIGMFPFIMVVAATVFFAPDWPRRWLRGRWLRNPRSAPARFGRARASEATTPPAIGRARGRTLGLAALAVYAAVQLLVPLRHYLYPGGVSWNEEGMRWSWKVMLREKHGSVTYYVRTPGSRGELQVPPHKYLDGRQAREMASQPDLILQLAHHIARDFRDRGYSEVEVRAEALVSLNGRPAHPMIDPEVDLARVDDGLSAKPWILPEPHDPPIQLRARRLP